MDTAIRWIRGIVGQLAAEVLKEFFLLEHHSFRGGHGQHTIPPGRYPGMHIPAHVHFNLWGADDPVHWTEELGFAGDSYLTEEMKSESQARGEFATIRPLSRDQGGVYHCEIKLRLQEKSNYPGK
jgi:protocatechuate 3,4-dioxygenase beta subunit